MISGSSTLDELISQLLSAQNTFASQLAAVEVRTKHVRVTILPFHNRVSNLIMHFGLVTTEVPTYSDTLGTREKCHTIQIVTVTRGSLVTNLSIGSPKVSL